jgi:glucosylceramidase
MFASTSEKSGTGPSFYSRVVITASLALILGQGACSAGGTAALTETGTAALAKPSATDVSVESTHNAGVSESILSQTDVSVASAESLAKGGHISLKNTANKCLGVGPDGVSVGLYACEGLGNQGWTAKNDTLLHSSGLCLDTQSANPTNGAMTKIAKCVPGKTTQQWTLSSKGIVQGNSSLCLDVKDFRQVEGTAVQLWACSQSINQVWQVSTPNAQPAQVQAFQSTPDLTQALSILTTDTGDNAKFARTDATLILDENKVFQSITGFGASLTDSSTFLLGSGLTQAGTDAAMARLFDPNTGIGISLLRQPLGTSDFSSVGNFSYADNLDLTLSNFSISQDKKYTIPLLQKALSHNPNIFIMGTPWSPPAWMKNNNNMYGSPTSGGSNTLKNEMRNTYAQYLVKTIQAYAAEGIVLQAITPQNEPLNDGTLPSLYLDGQNAATFVGQNLGPAFKAAQLKTGIWAYDHNWDRIDYPQTLLDNATSKPFVAAAAFHCYGGAPSAMTTFHNNNPKVPIEMTECSDGAWHTNSFADMTNLIIDSTNNWSRSVVFWNMALDPKGGPYNNGCTNCFGLVTVDPARKTLTYDLDYYVMGQASKFIRPKAVRIGNTLAGDNLKAATFRNQDGSLVALIYNMSDAAQTVAVKASLANSSVTVAPGGFVTVILAAKKA